jgi:ribonucleotide reductase beta subunit family protein with ferritin-like domain
MDSSGSSSLSISSADHDNRGARGPDGVSDFARKYCLCLPPRYSRLWEFYKLQVSHFWTAEEVDLSQDRVDWRELSDNERHFIKTVLAFFASSDGIVGENLGKFVEEVSHIKEAVFAYAFQFAMENIHSEMYSLLIDSYIADPGEKLTLFNAITDVPCVKRKADWALAWSASDRTLAERVIAFACVEGVHFSSSFCAIFWLKKRGLMPGLTFSNELISRDEGLHTDLACCVLGVLCERGEAEMPPQDTVARIFRDAVDIEAEYCREGLPVDLLGMNADLMVEYVEYVADRLLVQLGYERVFGRNRCPFDWMEDIGLAQRTNFFEGRVSEYVRAAAGNTVDENAFDVVVDYDADV